MKIKFQFKWFDFWVGAYIDVENNTLYICPFPMVVINIALPQRHYLIYSKYLPDTPIGCCSTCGKEDVLAEEPGSTFVRVKRANCPVCNEIESVVQRNSTTLWKRHERIAADVNEEDNEN